jgi:hypothetical protein
VNQELINALMCAVEVLQGTGGGYTSVEKKEAAMVLQLELQRQEADA